MEILQFPNPLLLTKCEPVTVFGPELIVILTAMNDTMVANRGVGLAANQVGVLLRMFVMKDALGETLNVINPTILSSSKAISAQREGCLSAPGEFVTTGSRTLWVQVQFQDVTGNSVTKVFDALQSVCVQHEIEHLDGKAFVQSRTIEKSKRREICQRWGLKSK